MVLHIFNPSHDEALASDSPFYNETKAAKLTAQTIAPLAAFWAEEGDYLLLPEGAERHNCAYARNIHYVYEEQLASLDYAPIERIEPWGWNKALVHRLRKLGVPERLLPGNKELEDIRQLSSRKTAVTLLSKLAPLSPMLIGESTWCTSFEETLQTIEHYGTAMLKAPWSGSGRGVFRTGLPMSENVECRIKKVLREQHAIEVEPYYHRKVDFAMEFTAEGNAIFYKGLSLFRTHTSGSYMGNIVANEDTLQEMLPDVSPELLSLVATACEKELSQLLAGHYRGLLGIDMMLVCEAGSGLPRLHPCVEINLRRTMGHAALSLRELLAPGEQGVLCAEGFFKEESPAYPNK